MWPDLDTAPLWQILALYVAFIVGWSAFLLKVLSPFISKVLKHQNQLAVRTSIRRELEAMERDRVKLNIVARTPQIPRKVL